VPFVEMNSRLQAVKVFKKPPQFPFKKGEAKNEYPHSLLLGNDGDLIRASLNKIDLNHYI
jgi:hypothetical protein